MSGLSGPTSQFLNGMHEFSELILVRMALLMDQSRLVLPLLSAKTREFGELRWENVRARLIHRPLLLSPHVKIESPRSGFCNPVVFRGWVIDPLPNPQPGGPVVFCRGFPSLSVRVLVI